MEDAKLFINVPKLMVSSIAAKVPKLTEYLIFLITYNIVNNVDGLSTKL